jgi:type IV secretory pathway TrbD component
MNGLGLVVLVAAAVAFGFFMWLLAKAAEVETARIARPTRMIFFMLGSLEKDALQSIIKIE